MTDNTIIRFEIVESNMTMTHPYWTTLALKWKEANFIHFSVLLAAEKQLSWFDCWIY